MHVDKVSRKLGLTILKADMLEDDFWAMTIEAPEGFVTGWPHSDGTASLAVRTKSLKSFLMAARTRRKASTLMTPGEWETPQDAPTMLARYRRNWQ